MTKIPKGTIFIKFKYDLLLAKIYCNMGALFKRLSFVTRSKYRLDFLHVLDKYLEDTQKNVNLLLLINADIWQKYAFLSKNGRKKSLKLKKNKHFR